jgi:hypothetical protein
VTVWPALPADPADPADPAEPPVPFAVEVPVPELADAVLPEPVAPVALLPEPAPDEPVPVPVPEPDPADNPLLPEPVEPVPTDAALVVFGTLLGTASATMTTRATRMATGP